MRIYETTFIINPQSDDATIEKHVGDVKDIITNTNGKIINENHMGTRRLAYEINKLTQGYYASFIYEAPTDVLSLLDRHFKINDAYIRNLTIRIEGDPEEYLKQQDPFGKHGTDRREGYQKPVRGSAPVKAEADTPAAEEASVEKTETTDASEEKTETVDVPEQKTETADAPEQKTETADTPEEDKPSEDEL